MVLTISCVHSHPLITCSPLTAYLLHNHVFGQGVASLVMILAGAVGYTSPTVGIVNRLGLFVSLYIGTAHNRLQRYCATLS